MSLRISHSPAFPRRTSARRGYIFLMSVLVIGVMLMATTISMLLLSWANEENGVTFSNSSKAQLLARSCADYGMKKLQASITYAGETLNFSSGTCTVSVIEGSGPFYRTICAEGVSGPVTRRMRVVVQQLYPTIVVSSYNEASSPAECGGVAGLSSSSASSGSGSSLSSAGSSASSQASIGTTSTVIAFDISSTGSITPLSALVTSKAGAVAVSGTSALLAGPTSSNELSVLNVSDPRSMSFAQGKAGPAAGVAVARGRGQVMIGTAKAGSTLGVLRLWTFTPGGVGTTGPWDFTTSGSALTIAADPTGCYAFVASNWHSKGMQVIKVQSQAMTLLSSFPVSSSTLGTPTALWHDPAADRVYLVTTKGFTILGPSTSSPSCP